MSDGFQLSGTFKALIGVIVLGGIAFVVLSNQQQREFEAQSVPSEGLRSLQGLDRTQVSTYETWCQKNKRPKEQLDDCVKRRQDRVKLLSFYDECAMQQAKSTLDGLNETNRAALVEEVTKSRARSTREPVQSNANAVEVTERDLIIKIKERLPNQASKAASQCAYQKVCADRGLTGEELASCVQGAAK